MITTANVTQQMLQHLRTEATRAANRGLVSLCTRAIKHLAHGLYDTDTVERAIAALNECNRVRMAAATCATCGAAEHYTGEVAVSVSGIGAGLPLVTSCPLTAGVR